MHCIVQWIGGWPVCSLISLVTSNVDLWSVRHSQKHNGVSVFLCVSRLQYILNDFQFCKLVSPIAHFLFHISVNSLNSRPYQSNYICRWTKMVQLTQRNHAISGCLTSYLNELSHLAITSRYISLPVSHSAISLSLPPSHTLAISRYLQSCIITLWIFANYGPNFGQFTLLQQLATI